MDMLGAILENNTSKLESLIMENADHINDPVGMPFDTPSSRFFGHPVMSQMVIMQHPDQTLLDIACGMPCGPTIWILLSHGAKGSRHPYGSDLALHNAIKNGRPYTVQALLVPGRSDANGFQDTAWKPLLQAVFWKHPEVVRIILRKGADIEHTGPSPRGPGSFTALQLCLDIRAARYVEDAVREKCNNILRILLEAGADIHVAPADESDQSTFEMFTKPWQSMPFWASRLSVIETDCLRMFINRGANLQIPFDGCPCGPAQRMTFEHQALWHSTPTIARLIIDGFIMSPSNNGSSLLHEVLGSCPDAKRHPADTLRDIQVLLHQGVDMNLVDLNGITPLRKCIEQCPAVDLVPRLRILLQGGANPEVEDRDGFQPFILAARTFEQPLLSEVMQALVSKMQGGYMRTINGAVRTWSSKHFPISETQTYEQVMSSSRSTGDFRLEMQDLVPEDVQEVFSHAYFAIVSKNFLDTMTRTARSRMLTGRDKDEIVWIIGMRTGIDLVDYRFDQELVVALLDPQPVLDMQIDSINMAITDDIGEQETEDATPRPIQVPTIENPAPASPPRPIWQFNPNKPTTSPPPPTRVVDHSQSPSIASETDLMPSTTIIRWRYPDRPAKPGDQEKANLSVLRYHCSICNDGVPLTKNEQEKHGVEHAHTDTCDVTDCMRRFCKLKGKNKADFGCQDHLFMGMG
jgi:ankyrin repeat protein